MNIFILSNQLNEFSGCNYYRSVVPGKYLHKLGKHSVLITNKIPSARSTKTFADDQGIIQTQQITGLDEAELEKYDVFVFQRYYMDYPAPIVGLVQWAKSKGRKVVYELDDLLTEIPRHNPCFPDVMLPSTQTLIQFLLKNADVITCASTALKDKYQGKLLPNCLDFEVWDEALAIIPVKHEKVRIGFVGGASHQEDLKMIAPVMKKLVERGDVEVHIFGINPDWDVPCVVEEFTKVSRYPFRMRKLAFDIGIAPLVKDNFNQFKSNIKWLEYSALEIPTVASNERPYVSIKDTTTGYLCNTLEDWERNLTLLIENPKLRHRIGKQAHTWVRSRYDIVENWHLWEEAYKK